MPSAPKKHITLSLNLLKNQEVPQKLPIRFARWLISYGRYIVILVEIVVIASFVARFKLDADLSDLKDKIDKGQIPFIESRTQDEALIRQTQARLSAIQKIHSSTPNFKDALGKISNQLPTGVKLTNITIEGLENSSSFKFKLSGQATNNNDLAIFSTGIKSEKAFSEVDLSNVSFDQGQITFNITGVIKP